MPPPPPLLSFSLSLSAWHWYGVSFGSPGPSITRPHVCIRDCRGAPQSACHACGMVEEYDDNLMLQCDKCRMTAHMDCYGVTEHPDGKLWLCDACK